MGLNVCFSLQKTRENAGALGWRLTPGEYVQISQVEVATR